MEFKLTVSFDADALEVLNRLAVALKDARLPAAADAAPAPVEIKPEPAVTPAPAEETPAQPAVEPVAEPEPVPAKEYTLEEIRSRVMALSRQDASKKAAVKQALNKYADSVPHLKKTDYAAFMAELEGIA